MNTREARNGDGPPPFNTMPFCGMAGGKIFYALLLAVKVTTAAGSVWSSTKIAT